MKTLIVFLVSLFLFSTPEPVGDPNVLKTLHQMFDSVKKIRTVSYRVDAIEREQNEFHRVHSEIKLQCQPRKLYLINPDRKLEILYDETLDHDKALVKSPTLSFLSLMLDPTGTLMRKNQHYSIHELGFDFVVKALALIIGKDPAGTANFIWHGKVVKNKRLCALIEYKNTQFSYVTYTVGNKETVSSIAAKLLVNEHIVRYKNNLLNDFAYLKPGRELLMPNLYLKRAMLYVDDKTYLPVSITAYDDKDMFECYDFSGVEVNKAFSPSDFDRNNKNYHF